MELDRWRYRFALYPPPSNVHVTLISLVMIVADWTDRARRLSIVKNIFHVFRIGDREDNFYHYRS